MNISENLNRSQSESQLSRLNLENLSIQDFDNSRKFSENSPYVKKTIFVVQEVYQPAFTRLRSGQSIPSHLDSIDCSFAQSFMDTTDSNNSNQFIKPHFQKTNNICLDNIDGVTPMDVDTSREASHNVSKIEDCLSEETMELDSDKYNYFRPRLNSLERVLKQRKFNREPLTLSNRSQDSLQISTLPKRKGFKYCFMLLLPILVTVVYFLFFHNTFIFVNNQIQVENLEKDLSKNMFHQKGPVNVIIRSLVNRNRWPNKIKVLGLIGSSGTGKTFVANILKNQFHPKLVNEMYGTQLQYKSQWEKVLRNVKSCCLNLIIIDDLSKKDTTELFAFVHALPKNHYILVVSVFSIQYSDDNLNYSINYHDIDGIRKEFDDSNLFHELAVFKEFNEDQAKDWLKKQLTVRNVKYSETQLRDILGSHNVLYVGLKGLLSTTLVQLSTDNKR